MTASPTGQLFGPSIAVPDNTSRWGVLEGIIAILPSNVSTPNSLRNAHIKRSSSPALLAELRPSI